MNPLVSVIIPTHGGGHLIENAVNSVLAQTYANIEIIVVDDNGLDTPMQKTTQLCMGKYSGLANVQYICHSVNRNGSAARNTGVQNSRGEYIALLDDDDEYYPENIECQINAIQGLSNDYALTYCHLESFIRECKVSEDYAKSSNQLLYDVLTHKVNIQTCSFLIKRKVWLELGGFDESYRRHQDWEFIARVCAKYNVYPVDYMGVRRNIEFRNSPATPEIAKEYRLYFLEMMKPYISQLSDEQRKRIISINRLSVSVEYLKAKRVKDFFQEYRDINPGLFGVQYFIMKIFTIIKRGKLEIK